MRPIILIALLLALCSACKESAIVSVPEAEAQETVEYDAETQVLTGGSGCPYYYPMAKKVSIFYGSGYSGAQSSSHYDAVTGEKVGFITYAADPLAAWSWTGVYVVSFSPKFVHLQTMAGDEMVYSGFAYAMTCEGQCACD